MQWPEDPPATAPSLLSSLKATTIRCNVSCANLAHLQVSTWQRLLAKDPLGILTQIFIHLQAFLSTYCTSDIILDTGSARVNWTEWSLPSRRWGETFQWVWWQTHRTTKKTRLQNNCQVLIIISAIKEMNTELKWERNHQTRIPFQTGVSRRFMGISQALGFRKIKEKKMHKWKRGWRPGSVRPDLVTEADIHILSLRRLLPKASPWVLPCPSLGRYTGATSS